MRPELKNYPKFAVIFGGARSGKSALGERLARATGLPRIYLATAEAGDDEMQDRIRRHRDDRGAGWTTLEVPVDLPGMIAQVPNDSVILIDCLTLWLSNLMLAGEDVDAMTHALLAVLATRRAPTVCVSNELGLGLVPETTLGRRFRDMQGRLNRDVAAQADLAVFVVAGLPLVLKGALPEGVQ